MVSLKFCYHCNLYLCFIILFLPGFVCLLCLLYDLSLIRGLLVGLLWMNMDETFVLEQALWFCRLVLQIRADSLHLLIGFLVFVKCWSRLVLINRFLNFFSLVVVLWVIIIKIVMIVMIMLIRQLWFSNWY